jgi:hypothetical protein
MKKNEMGGACGTYGTEENHTKAWWEKQRVNYHLENQSVDGRIIIRWIFRNWDVGTWTGSIWLRIGTDGGHINSVMNFRLL